MNNTSLPEVNMEFKRKFVSIHHDIAIGQMKENEFDRFVITHKEQFNHPEYLEVFAEQIELTDKYFSRHYQTCAIFFDYMMNNPSWKDFDFGVRIGMKLYSFVDKFQYYSETLPQ